jgi:2-keto-4-pentenoate hydratase/2-oxohepta-3-ene-1,7-dioic acid hydratase in catechol pathway
MRPANNRQQKVEGAAMILATFEGPRRDAAIGVVDPENRHIVDLLAAAGRIKIDPVPFHNMLALMDAGERALDTARKLFDRFRDDPEVSHLFSEVRLVSPVPEPRSLRDFSAFPTHLRQAPLGMRKLATRVLGEEKALAAYGPPLTEPPPVAPLFRERPIFYKGNRLSVVGTDHDVRWPSYSQYMDYELEFGVFIGRKGMNISVAAARSHIFGFAIFNDFSARDAQMPEMASRFGPCKGKDFDTGNVIGPWIVTADEIAEPYRLRMEARVNGEVRSKGDSSGMLHGFEDMIAYASRDETLHPGEFLASGTMGNGCGLEQDRYLADGDVVELEVERIGVLRNRLVRPK